MKSSAQLKFFTLIELLIVISVIGIIISISFVSFSNVRQKGRDTKRIADIKLIQKSLEDYYRDEGLYPAALTPGQSLVGSSSTITYTQIIPQNPTPRNDGACPNNEYVYETAATGTSYKIEFCLSEPTAQLTAGSKCATPQGILNESCNPILPITSNLKLWLKADSGIVKDGGDLISEWDDSSDNANDATQSDPAKQPLWVSNQLNGKPVVRFSHGSNLYTSLTTPDITLGQRTEFMVIKRNGDSPDTYHSIMVSANPPYYQLYAYNSNEFFQSYIDGGVNHNLTFLTSYQIIDRVVSENHVDFYQNGIAGDSGTPVTGLSGQPIIIGAWLTYALNGDIAELIIYDYAMNDTERGQIEDYLNIKYNLY